MVAQGLVKPDEALCVVLFRYCWKRPVPENVSKHDGCSLLQYFLCHFQINYFSRIEIERLDLGDRIEECFDFDIIGTYSFGFVSVRSGGINNLAEIGRDIGIAFWNGGEMMEMFEAQKVNVLDCPARLFQHFSLQCL